MEAMEPIQRSAAIADLRRVKRLLATAQSLAELQKARDRAEAVRGQIQETPTI
jgi:hypothetical protein